MLRVLGCQNIDICSVLMDDHIPVRFECGQRTDAPLYWRTGNFSSSLIEIGLTRETGAICRVVITSIDPSAVSNNDTVPRCSNRLQGVPLCDVSAWPSESQLLNSFGARFKDEPGPVAINVAEDNIGIWLSSTRSLRTMYDVGQVTFGVDEDGLLIYLSFGELKDWEMDVFIRYLEARKQC